MPIFAGNDWEWQKQFCFEHLCGRRTKNFNFKIFPGSNKCHRKTARLPAVPSQQFFSRDKPITTDEFRLYHEQTFDSFSKRVIKHIAIDIHNAEAALSKVEVSLSTLPYSEAAKLAAEDTYDLGDDVCVRFDLLGIPIEVHDPALGQALSSLSPKRRDVVLLFYFAQIGKLLNITTMAVNSRRRKALAALRELLEVEYGA